MHVENEEENSQTGSDNSSSPRGSQHHQNSTSIWEWVVAAIGLVLVLGSMGFILYKGLRSDEPPPDVKVRVHAITPVSNGYHVEFVAKNEGGATLAEVVIVAALKQGAEEIESSETTIDYIAADSEKKGGFFFRKNPNEFSLEIHAANYQLP